MEKFKVLLEDAIKTHYEKLTSEFDDIYGYVLYTSDCRMSIGPVSNRESVIKAKEGSEDYDYYRYGANEWSMFEDYKLFDEVNDYLSKCYDESKENFEDYVEKFDEYGMQVLLNLAASGLFGEKNDSRFLCFFFVDSHNSITIDSSLLLNTKLTHEKFASEFS